MGWEWFVPIVVLLFLVPFGPQGKMDSFSLSSIDEIVRLTAGPGDVLTFMKFYQKCRSSRMGCGRKEGLEEAVQETRPSPNPMVEFGLGRACV